MRNANGFSYSQVEVIEQETQFLANTVAPQFIEDVARKPRTEAEVARNVRYHEGERLREEANDAMYLEQATERSHADASIITPAHKRNLASVRTIAAKKTKALNDFIAATPKIEEFFDDALYGRYVMNLTQPMRQKAIAIPKQYSKAEEGLHAIRNAMMAATAQITELQRARLPREDAKRNSRRAIERMVRRKNDAVNFSGPTRPEVTDDDRLLERDPDISDSIALLLVAQRANILALSDSRIDSLYDKFEFNGDLIVSLSERTEKIATLRAEITRLEEFEGEVLRTLWKRGKKVTLRPDSNIANILGLEPDPNAVVAAEEKIEA